MELQDLMVCEETECLWTWERMLDKTLPYYGGDVEFSVN